MRVHMRACQIAGRCVVIDHKNVACDLGYDIGMPASHITEDRQHLLIMLLVQSVRKPGIKLADDCCMEAFPESVQGMAEDACRCEPICIVVRDDPCCIVSKDRFRCVTYI